MSRRALAVKPSSPHATATMKANRRRDTSPELQVRSALHRRGLRFRVDRAIRTERGVVRPDIVFVTAQVAVFIDGCYWHSCADHGELPQANRDFWRAKFAANVARDKAQTAALEEAGWKVVRFWEHDQPDRAADDVDRLITSRGATTA